MREPGPGRRGAPLETPPVLIPAGEFWMGSPEGEGHDDEHPRHRVRLRVFLLDRNPVTAGQFAAFCRRTRRPLPEQPAWSTDDHPVVNVSWDDARDYCDARQRIS